MRKYKWLAKNVRFTFLYTQRGIIEGGTVTLDKTYPIRTEIFRLRKRILWNTLDSSVMIFPDGNYRIILLSKVMCQKQTNKENKKQNKNPSK